MAKTKTTAFEPADYLDSEEARLAYLNEAFESGDSAEIARALGTVAKARGMAAIAEQSGLNREGLYRSLSAGGNPGFDTVMKVLDSMDLELSVRSKNAG